MFYLKFWVILLLEIQPNYLRTIYVKVNWRMDFDSQDVGLKILVYQTLYVVSHSETCWRFPICRYLKADAKTVFRCLGTHE